MRYAMIDKLRNQHPVAKSGYQAWHTGKVAPPRKLEELRLLVAIKAAHQRGRGTFGPKKIQDELANQGIVAGLNRIKSGWPTSPIFRPMRAGSIWPHSRICTPVKWHANVDEAVRKLLGARSLPRAATPRWKASL